MYYDWRPRGRCRAFRYSVQGLAAVNIVARRTARMCARLVYTTIMSRNRRVIVGVVTLLVVVYAVGATISLVFFPIESDEAPPETVTVTESITLEP